MAPAQEADMPSTTSPEAMQLAKATHTLSAASTPMLSSDPSFYTSAADLGSLSDSANPPTSTRFSPAASIASTFAATNHNQLPTSSTSTASANTMTSPKATYLRKMMQDDPERYIFRFFDLPRELRDFIYDELLISHVFVKLECHLEIDACNVVRPKLMTINRQFAHEYKERAEKTQAATVTDRPYVQLECLDAALEPLPKLLAGTRELRVDCAGLASKLALHRDWISAVVTAMPCIKSLSLKIVLSVDDDEIIDTLREIATLPSMALLEVFAKDERYDTFDFEDQNLRILRWSAQGGLWEKFEHEGAYLPLSRLVRDL